MTTRTVKLLGSDRVAFATAQVTDDGRHYGGTVDLRATPIELRALFGEFEEVVNGQLFSYLDDVQGRIAALTIRAVFDDRSEARVRDLQVFPSTGDISFRVEDAPAEAARVGSAAHAGFPAESPAAAQSPR